MKKPILYILCGPSGAGKSTWAKKFIEDHFEDDIRYVSRDEIRFSMLKHGDSYFTKESEVFKHFVGILRQTLVDGFDVVADATHLNHGSRAKLINGIGLDSSKYDIICVVFNTDEETCIARNKERNGLANVPESVIHDMCHNFHKPHMNEFVQIKEIIEI